MSFTILFGCALGIFIGAFGGSVIALMMRFPIAALLSKTDSNESAERKDASTGFLYAIAILLSVAAIFIAIYSAYFMTSGIHTQGVITEIKEIRDEQGAIRRKPIYQYSDKTGALHSDFSNLKDGTEYSIGDKVPIIYLADSPVDSRIDNFAHHWFASIFLISIALGLGLAPGILSRLTKLILKTKSPD